MQRAGKLTVTGWLAVLAACAGGPRASAGQDDYEFDCKDRHTSYVVLGGFVAPEMGISLECADAGPQLVKWTVDDSGQRDERTHRMTGAEFDDTWQELEDTGWRNLSDCLNQRAGADDEVYTFEVGDHASQSRFVCQGKATELPFPFDRLVTALDVAAARYN